MFASYLVTAVRALQRDPWHAAVNIVGLSVALAASLLIGLYVRHELSYENFITQPDRVYRVETDFTLPGRPVDRWGLTPYPVPELMQADFDGQVASATRLIDYTLSLLVDGRPFRRFAAIVDENFFDVIDLPVAQGDARAAVRRPDALILSRRMAKELFGTEDAIGRTVRVNDTADMTVAAILENPRGNTQFDYDIIGSIASQTLALPPGMSARWGNVVQYSFVRLDDGVEADALARQLPDFVARHRDSAMNFDLALHLRPLRQVHLAASPEGKISNRNQISIAALTATGVFLIFIACFSYMNLATARSLLRIREVGLRKILGGRSRHLALQFLAESVVVTTAAFAVATLLAALLLPVFGHLVDRDLHVLDMVRPGFIAAAFGLILLVSVGAGAYPAFVLASRKPVALFESKRGVGGRGGLLRTGIVGLQFAMTIALMIAAVVAFVQITYLRNIDLGFDESGLLIVTIQPGSTDGGRGQVFREQLAQSPYFVETTGGGITPRAGYERYLALSRPGDAPDASQPVLTASVGDHFFDVYGVAPLAGRVFSDDPSRDVVRQPTAEQPTGQSPVVISESLLPKFGLGEAGGALGKELSFNAGPAGRVILTIIGVVPDIHFRLGHEDMAPIAYLPLPPGTVEGEVTARVRPGAAQPALEQAQEIWAGIFPEQTMDYEFLEDRIQAANADDARQSGLFGFFGALALFVACLGLFALASFVAARRAFEVAVRKVLGASTQRAARLLMWDFARPILLANVVGWPLAYAMIRPWLDRFPYRIELSPLYFLGVSALALAVAMVTVFMRTWKTARARPAAVLRTE